MHLATDEDRRTGLEAVRAMLAPGGRFIFDVFSPPADRDDAERAQWIDRGPSLAERDEIDWERRVVRVTLRMGDEVADVELGWLDRDEWRTTLAESGFRVHACYGWFDRRPCGLGPHSVWVTVRLD
jgi:hypothetical protein